MITTSDWIKYFPFETVRPQQEEAINFALNEFENNRYVILELPTGVGKSAIAVTLSRYYQDFSANKKASWIITTQRILQKQYQKDFNDIPTIWSKLHYECPDKMGISCQLGTLINGVMKDKYCQCIYKQDKKIFLDSSVSVTNIAFLLNHIEYTQEIDQRKLLVVDECHNLESAITDFVSITLNKYEIEGYDLKWVDSKNIESVVRWIDSILIPRLDDLKSSLKSKLKVFTEQTIFNDPAGKKGLKQLDAVDRYICQLNRCVSRFVADEWIMSINRENDEITLKPIFASKYAENQLFKSGERVLLMSGTILNKEVFCKNIGVPLNRTSFLSLDSPFKKENRAVFVIGAGSLSYNNIDKNLPRIAQSIHKIINGQHKDDRGIIHCVSYKIANYIVKNVRHNNRFIVHDSSNRMEMYDLHINSKKPTILISPSMTEGVDLYDDLSRFQIIVKVPFPYLGDNFIKTKMKRVLGWYEWETAKTIIQASGRSVRHENDYTITYILDSDMTGFFARNSNYFPQWYKDAMIFV